MSDTSQATVSPTSITFSENDWDSPKKITLAGLDNVSYGISGTYFVNLGPSVSSDILANGLTQKSLSILNRDHRKLIFQTSIGTDGNLGGISGADANCNSDPIKPVNTGTYKAMITMTGVRIASVTANVGDGQIDWVLLPNQLYTRSNGATIMTTNSASLFVFATNLTNSIGTNGNAIRTGMNSDWTGGGGCGNWLLTGPFAPYGTANRVDGTSLNDGNLICSSIINLYCVQQ